MSVEIKADIRHWLRELDKKYFFVMLGFAVMVYFPLISQRLVNTFDGLWNGSWFIEAASGNCRSADGCGVWQMLYVSVYRRNRSMPC